MFSVFLSVHRGGGCSSRFCHQMSAGLVQCQVRCQVQWGEPGPVSGPVLGPVGVPLFLGLEGWGTGGALHVGVPPPLKNFRKKISAGGDTPLVVTQEDFLV